MSKKNNVSSPIIYEMKIENNDFFIDKNFIDANDKNNVLTDYPVVYIHNWETEKKEKQYEVYVGESIDIYQRTGNHIKNKTKKGSWQSKINDETWQVIVIGHEHFNKSMTLDIENTIYDYLVGVDSVKQIHNGRGNPQKKYYPDMEKDKIFQKIWKKLNKINSDLFPTIEIIKNSALFKASPFKKLTDDQLRVSNDIYKYLHNAYSNLTIKKSKSDLEQYLLSENILGGENKHNIYKYLDKMDNFQGLIFVNGGAGTGKTVLNTNIFYNISKPIYEFDEEDQLEKIKNKECFLLVNNKEHIILYQEIAKKIGIEEDRVFLPTTFINRMKKNPQKVDIVFIDEAHLLATQNNQGYKGNGHLLDILKVSKYVVVMFDEKQIINRTQLIQKKEIEILKEIAKFNGSYFELNNQLRINGSEETVNWIKSITNDGIINPYKKDSKYDLKIFDDPFDLEKAIKDKNEIHGNSRILATYDWLYKNGEKPEHSNTWNVIVHTKDGKVWKKPWNYQLEKNKRKIKGLSWVEIPETIDEVGSTFTVQGFDLNYVGVILGPSIGYKNGKITYDYSKSKNDKINKSRRFDIKLDNEVEDYCLELLKNEVNILLTRGVKGLYIYAYDKQLREALLEFINNKK
ncbi:DUF2075 domain-containing protein [Streptobacillus felis]|uniref:DUF2075 domain-containing protein n=1 Tax=Streptobacillus felis TaxID=1384509 RepID=A0A7Z0PFU2_9FUSO|nr:DNA/RNA helicase domain-containing protein [Streptobacillus felis]NYV27933.1 DUF2075 domain-containing protein [Streptobacillus felis]